MGKRFLLSIVVIIITFSAYAQIELNSEEKQFLQENPIIKFAITNYPPFEYADETNQFHGLTIDLINWISTQYNFRVHFSKVTIDGAQKKVHKHELDLISTFFYSKKRDRIFDFTLPIYQIPANIFIPADRTDIQNISHLENKRIALQRGDYAVDYLIQQNFDFQAVFAKDYSEAVDLLAQKRADALVGDEPVIFYHLYQKKLSDKIKKVGKPLYVADDCLGSWEGNTTLISIMNKGIRSAQRSGYFDKLQQKWLGTIISTTGNFFSIYWRLITILISIIILALIIFAILNRRLSKQVHARTLEISKANTFLKSEIAERKQAQEALSHSLKLLNALVEQSPLGISVRDKTGTLLLANQAWKKIWGIPDKEFKHQFQKRQKLQFDASDNYLGKYKDKIKKIYETGGELLIPEIDIRNNKRATAAWISQRFYSINDESENVDSIVIITEDITKAKRNELRIKESEVRYRMLYQEIRDAIILENAEEEILDANAAACELFDYPYEELITKHSYEFQPEDIQAKGIRKIYSASFTDLSETFETEILTRKGKRIAVEVTTGSFQTASGEKRILSVLHNIEDRKRREQQLRATNKELHKLKENLQKQVNAAVQELRNKDHLLIKQSRQAAMGEMIGNIAHQWRQPLSAVAAIVQDIEDAYEYDELTEEYLHSSVEKTMKQLSYMSRTIDDFRNFFKPNKEKKDFSVQKVLEDTINFVEKSFSFHNIKINLVVKQDSTINGFPNEYSQTVLNILNNSKDAIVENKINPGKINIVANINEKGQSVVSIEDNGGGIPANIIDKIFDPYFSTKEQGKGTGIGLYMSKTIIEDNMNGKIAVQNIGDGVKFTIVV
ncbi:MAG: polar amino acid transport system substrate-binding protein [Candidatus Cloacimonadota bacterium]|jgi:PAS domain S-box-containing protein|nr:polar amino acid transport system substrate-binding protein [Candidatus Cloacimonadota bacterium]